MIKAGVDHRGGEGGGARGHSDIGAGNPGTYKIRSPQAAAWGDSDYGVGVQMSKQVHGLG